METGLVRVFSEQQVLAWRAWGPGSVLHLFFLQMDVFCLRSLQNQETLMRVGPTDSEVGAACDGEHLKTPSEQEKAGRRR